MPLNPRLFTILMYVLGASLGCTSDPEEGTLSRPDAADSTLPRDGSTLPVEGTDDGVGPRVDQGPAPDAGVGGPDGATPDADIEPDAAMTDAASPDAEAPDGDTPDAQMPDAQMPDAQTPDAQTPDAQTPDADLPGPDAEAPDAGPPAAHPCYEAADPLPELEGAQAGRRITVDAFPGLQGLTARRVVVYLPEAYDEAPARRFPVMYMHDGQNLFDGREAAFGVAWEVDDTLDALTRAGDVEPVIVVAIDNDGLNRISDYTPSVDPEFGGGSLPLYGRWMAERLKPWIDNRLRTECEPHRTGIGGSSLGGLASLWLLRERGDVFGRALCMSSSLWWNGGEALGWGAALAESWPEGGRLWLDGGNAEGGGPDVAGDGLSSVIRDNRRLLDALIEGGLDFGAALGAVEAPSDAHDEAAWARRLPEALRFLWGADAPEALTDLELRLYADALPIAEPKAVAVDAELPGVGRVTVPSAALSLSSDDPEVATVSPDGLATGHAEGGTTLRARLEADPAQAAALPVAVDDGVDLVTVRFEVTVPAFTPVEDTIYVTGDQIALGPWQPGAVPLGPIGANLWMIELPLPAGPFEFKFTRGTWDEVEKGAQGEEIANRRAVAEEGLVIEATVLNWADIR